jgi:glucokinase-like ROK family protein
MKHKDYCNLKLNILDSIREKDSMTKADLSRELNVNITTITGLVNELTQKCKILIESGKAESIGGRKAKKYKINGTFGYILGVDIGGVNTRVILTDLMGNLISELKTKRIEEHNGNEFIQKIIESIDAVIKKSSVSKEKVLGIGIGISGIIDTESGYSLFCPNIKELNDYNIRDVMEKNLKLPVIIDDSARCMAIAEKKYGIAKNNKNFIFITLGKGIGAGIFKDGQIYRGSLGLAGELGHITVSENGPICNCGNRGCLEAIASSTGIVKRAIEGIKEGISTSIISEVNGNLSEISTEIIAKAAEEGDKFAYSLIERTGEYIGIAIATALNLFGSRLVVIGGGVSEIGDIMINSIKRTVKMRALNIISKKVRIIPSELGELGAPLGAAANCTDLIFNNYILDLFN